MPLNHSTTSFSSLSLWLDVECYICVGIQFTCLTMYVPTNYGLLLNCWVSRVWIPPIAAPFFSSNCLGCSGVGLPLDLCFFCDCVHRVCYQKPSFAAWQKTGRAHPCMWDNYCMSDRVRWLCLPDNLQTTPQPVLKWSAYTNTWREKNLQPRRL